jgi:predicted aspartyl protease
MGTFTVGCLIRNHMDREKAVQIPRLMVDTGSEATWVPIKLLEQIGVKREKRLAYQMANGQWVYRDVGYALIRVGQRETIDEIVFAEKGDYVTRRQSIGRTFALGGCQVQKAHRDCCPPCRQGRRAWESGS